MTRAERPKSLEKDFLEFLKHDVGAASLDDDGDKETRPDFLWDDEILIEVKTLKTPPSNKINHLLESEKEVESWPLSFGDLGAGHLRDSGILARNSVRISKKLEAAIRGHTQKANKQILEFSTSREKNYAGVLVLLNEDNREYSHSLVMNAVQREIKSGEKTTRTSYDGIDRVIYISEAHFTITSPTSVVAYQVSQLLNEDDKCLDRKSAELIHRWCSRNSAPELTAYRGDGSNGNGTIDILSNKMPQHELWRIDYRKNQYLSGYTKKKLVVKFCEFQMFQLLAGHKSSPTVGTSRNLMDTIESFTHLLEEFARRGTDMKTVVPTTPIQDKALKALRISEVERQFLVTTFNFHANGFEYRPTQP